MLDSLSAGPELVLLAEHIRDLLAEGMAFDDVRSEEHTSELQSQR